MDVRCLECNGKGCRACNETGTWELTRCPFKETTANAMDAVWAAAQAREFGVWPNGSGWMGETQLCMEAFRFVWWAQGEADRQKQGR